MHSSHSENTNNKLQYIYQHFQENKKIHEPISNAETLELEQTLYPHLNNQIDYGLFEDIIDSHYLDAQIKQDFECDTQCYTEVYETQEKHLLPCTQSYHHISHNITDINSQQQQEEIFHRENESLLFTTDTTQTCMKELLL